MLLFDELSGALHLHKPPSTLHEQSVGILEGIRGLLERAQMRPADICALLHGTTVSTNIVLEEIRRTGRFAGDARLPTNFTSGPTHKPPGRWPAG
ncbi:MAG: hypothetical protein GKR94_14250 [Gammaproteobacteria bacterium]|nr:hypothetical protein [Gammaproteobacteria bacterium]